MLLELCSCAPDCLRGVPPGCQQEGVRPIQGEEVLDQEIMLLNVKEPGSAHIGHQGAQKIDVGYQSLQHFMLWCLGNFVVLAVVAGDYSSEARS